MPYKAQLDCRVCPCDIDESALHSNWTDWAADLPPEGVPEPLYESRWCRICGRGMMRRIGGPAFGYWTTQRR